MKEMDSLKVNNGPALMAMKSKGGGQVFYLAFDLKR
jgi:hypothetical protein